MKVDRYVEFNPRIIRGLDYYTGIVFEAWDVGGDGRAVLGGGHYDNLVSDVGGDPLPGVGFAMGDVMISILLEKYGKILKGNQSGVQVLITLFDESTGIFSYELLAELHKVGIKSVVFPQPAKLQKQFKFADKLGIPLVIIAGPSEIETGNVALKNLKDGSQRDVPIDQIIEVLRSMIAL
jgi:histidyl-tRNA synthetase